MQPMLACPLDIVDVSRKASGYVMEPKLDGVRVIVTKRGDNVILMSRSKKQDFGPKVPHLVESLLQVPYDFVLDGELGYASNWEAMAKDSTWPILDFNQTMRVLGSGVDVALSKQSEEDTIFLWLFDCLHLSEGAMDSARRETLEHLFFRDLNRAGYAIDLVVRLAEWDEDLYVEYVEAGGEGVMLKNPRAPYKPGKRPANHWFKVKKFDAIDVFITGSIPGQGKYEGQIGALTFVTPQGVEGKCSGMTDEQRLQFSCFNVDCGGHRFMKGGHLDPRFYQKHMEIRFFGMVGKGETGLRHPQFIRLRPDLDA